MNPKLKEGATQDPNTCLVPDCSGCAALVICREKSLKAHPPSDLKKLANEIHRNNCKDIIDAGGLSEM